MSTASTSYLKELNLLTKVKVLSFKDLDYDNFLKTGKIVEGQISFEYPERSFDMSVSHYEFMHNEKTYRFSPSTTSHDTKGNTIVSGSLHERN